MVLTPGTRLGPYEVLAKIGEGGMGEVYRATDTNLKRQVAIKVLPESVAADSQRLARFQREAEVLASLNHPNIAQIHGLEKSEGTIALVMELVESPTVADRIGQGAIPVEEALTIAKQIAEALEAAHEQGIIHRDLKPANVKVRDDGTVKVLDFGLAKAMEPTKAMSPSGSQSPTITTPAMTQAGMILGTAAYMAPEQALGKPVDKRADIWAFGCVLYEMLTGRRAFDADSVPATLAIVLTAEVEWTALSGATPRWVRRLLERCLDRDPRRRLRDVGEARVLIEAGEETESEREESQAPTAGAVRVWVGAAAVLLVAGGLLGSVITTRWRGPADDAPQMTQTSVLLPPGMNFSAPGRRYLAISGDGDQVVYSADPGLVLRRLDERESLVVPGVQQDSRSPFFSPDGGSLGYYASGALWRLPLSGGAPVRIVDAINPWSASWSADGTILYGQGSDGIWRVSEDGGEADQVVAVQDGESAHGPQLLPGGEWVIFTLLPAGAGAWDRARLVAHSLDTQDRVLLVEGGRDGRYVPSGHLVYGLGGDLLAVSLNVPSMRVGPSSVELVENVADAGDVTGAMQFDVSATGSLIYAPAASAANSLQLAWVDATGRAEVLPGEPRAYRHPRVSPQGTRIVAEVEEPNEVGLWVGEADRGAFAPLTLEGGVNSHAEWTPDGTGIVFYSARRGGGLFLAGLAGAGPVRELLSHPPMRPASWTVDRHLLYEEFAGGEVHARGIESEDQESNSFALVDVPTYFDVLHPTSPQN